MPLPITQREVLHFCPVPGIAEATPIDENLHAWQIGRRWLLVLGMVGLEDRHVYRISQLMSVETVTGQFLIGERWAVNGDLGTACCQPPTASGKPTLPMAMTAIFTLIVPSRHGYATLRAGV